MDINFYQVIDALYQSHLTNEIRLIERKENVNLFGQNQCYCVQEVYRNSSSAAGSSHSRLSAILDSAELKELTWSHLFIHEIEYFIKIIILYSQEIIFSLLLLIEYFEICWQLINYHVIQSNYKYLGIQSYSFFQQS